MHVFFVVLAVVVVLAASGLQIWMNAGPLARRGREARAANGGRHTAAWWWSIAAMVVIALALVITSH